MPSLEGNPNAPNILAIAILSIILTPTAFALRIWARYLSALDFWVDDVLMGIALIGCWAISADNIIGVCYGFGYHVSDLSYQDQISYAKTLYAFFFLQPVTLVLIKMSLLLLYIRIFPSRRFHLVIYTVGAFVLAAGATVILGFAFQCTPVSGFWDHTINSKCINQPVFTTVASVLHVSTDFVIYTMPLPSIWKLQMNTRQKSEITFVFLIGGFICFTGIIRLIETIRLDVEDLTWSNVGPAIWNMVESEMGFVAANLPLMGPLFAKAQSKMKMLRQSYGSSRDRSGTRISSKSAAGSHQRGFKRMVDPEINLVTTTAQHVRPDSSEIVSDTIPLHGIKVKRTIEQGDSTMAPWLNNQDSTTRGSSSE